MGRSVSLNYSLTKNFRLIEFLVSPTADEKGFNEQYDPSDEIISNLKELCVNVLQPARDELGFTFTIASGYRCPRLNASVKGASKTSDHMKGMAADIKCQDNKLLFDTLKKYNFKQLINEYNYTWIHVSYDRNNNKKQILNIS